MGSIWRFCTFVPIGTKVAVKIKFNFLAATGSKRESLSCHLPSQRAEKRISHQNYGLKNSSLLKKSWQSTGFICLHVCTFTSKQSSFTGYFEKSTAIKALWMKNILN